MGEQFYYIFYSLLSGLTNLIAFTSFLVNPLNTRQKLIFILSGSVIYYLHMIPLQIIPSNLVIGLLIGTNLLLIFLFQKNHFFNLICALLNYMFSTVINNLVLVILGYLGYGMDWIKEVFYYELIFLLLQILWLYGINSLLGRFIRRIYFHRLARILNNASYKRYFRVLRWSLLLAIGFFIFNLTYGLMAGYPVSLQIYNCVSFALLFLILGIMVCLLLKSIQKEHLIKLKQTEQAALRDYTSQIESLYQETRAFRHDYLNILSTMNGYFMTQDYEGLKTYFNNNLSMLNTESSRQNAALGKLANISVPELKGLLYYKLFAALQTKLQVTVDIPTHINDIPMDVVDFIRILGILLDNALEASMTTDEKYFYVGIGHWDEGLTVRVENSCEPIDNVEVIFQQGYSTKGSERGLGLWEIRNLLKNYPSVTLHTDYQNKHLSQELEITYEKRV